MATAAMPADLVDHTTVAALEEKKKLQKHFARFDILFFLICTLVGLDTIGAAASYGAQAFTWLIFLAVFFFFPYALLTSELGSSFPEEGGPYVWTKLAFGRFVAAVNAFVYWVSNPIWVGGTLAIISLQAFKDFILPNTTITAFWEYTFMLVFIWISVWAAILSFKTGKWIPTIGAWVRMLLLGFFTFSVIVYAFEHGVHGFGGHAFVPSYVLFIGLVPILFFNYVGFELPSAAGEEMKDPQKDVPFTVARSAIGTVILYGGPILAILLVLPTSQITNIGGFLDAIKAVFTVYGGHTTSSGVVLTGFGAFLGNLCCIGLILAYMSSGTTWLMGADRAQAVAGFDGAGPRVLGIFSKRWGTPIVVNLMSGIMATIVMVMAMNITHGNAQKYFTVVLGLAISTTTISYLFIFPAIIRLRYSHRDVPRPYRIPWGNAGAWVCGGLCTFWALLASVVLVWPGFGVGWFGTSGTPNGSLPTGFTRMQYEQSQFIPLIVIFAIGLLFYAAGTKTRRQSVAIPFTEELAADAQGPI